jgi:tetratricopeptide (TPR) repeat protein
VTRSPLPRLSLLTAAVVLFVAPAARAQAAEPSSPSDARTEYERALSLYQRGQYAEAILPLRRAYELYPSPELLYDLAQAERLAGDCEGALASYRDFLATEPSEPLRSRASSKLDEMERCSEESRSNATPPSSSAPEAAVAEPAAAAPPPAEPTRAPTPAAVAHGSARDTRTPYVMALAGVSLAAFTLSGIAYATYSAKNRDAQALCPHTPPEACAPSDADHHNELVSEARTARTFTYVGFGTGVAAGAASLALALLPRRAPSSPGSRWSFQADAGTNFVRIGAASSW